MYIAKQLEEASDYLIKNYKGMKDIILNLGKERPVSTIILNLYRFRKLENYGCSLEDIFMEVYVAILDMDITNKHIANLTSFIRHKIIKYIEDEIDITISSMEISGPIEIKLNDIQFRKMEHDIDDEIEPKSLSFIDNILDKHIIECLLNVSDLSEREMFCIEKYFMEDWNQREISDVIECSSGYIGQILDKALRKFRSACRHELKYDPRKI